MKWNALFLLFSSKIGSSYLHASAIPQRIDDDYLTANKTAQKTPQIPLDSRGLQIATGLGPINYIAKYDEGLVEFNHEGVVSQIHGHMDNVQDIEKCADGYYYAVNRESLNIDKYDKSFNLVGSIPTNAGGLMVPSDVDCLENGNLFVSGSFVGGASHLWLKEIDQDGDRVWSYGNEHENTYVFHSEPLANGNILVADFPNNKVSEIKRDGAAVWEHRVSRPIDVHKLDNGNVLIATDDYSTGVLEVDPDAAPSKRLVWQYPNTKAWMVQRMANGNTAMIFWDQSYPFRIVGPDRTELFRVPQLYGYTFLISEVIEHPDYNVISQYSGWLPRPVLFAHGVETDAEFWKVETTGSKVSRYVPNSIPVYIAEKFEVMYDEEDFDGLNFNGIEFFQATNPSVDVRTMAKELTDTIRDVLDKYFGYDWSHTDSAKIDFVGHGQSGLALREAMRLSFEDKSLENPMNHINHIVTVGTPHEGTRVKLHTSGIKGLDDMKNIFTGKLPVRMHGEHRGRFVRVKLWSNYIFGVYKLQFKYRFGITRTSIVYDASGFNDDMLAILDAGGSDLEYASPLVARLEYHGFPRNSFTEKNVPLTMLFSRAHRNFLRDRLLELKKEMRKNAVDKASTWGLGLEVGSMIDQMFAGIMPYFSQFDMEWSNQSDLFVDAFSQIAENSFDRRTDPFRKVYLGRALHRDLRSRFSDKIIVGQESAAREEIYAALLSPPWRMRWTVKAKARKPLDIGCNGDYVKCFVMPDRKGTWIYRINHKGEYQSIRGPRDFNASRVDVDPQGNPWVFSEEGDVWQWTGGDWLRRGSQMASDVGIGADGTVFITGNEDYYHGGRIWKFNKDSQTWKRYSGVATRVSVDPRGNPWVINKIGQIWRYWNWGWFKVEGCPPAHDIGIGADGTVMATAGSPVLKIYLWRTRDTWTTLNDKRGKEISLGRMNDVWTVTEYQHLQHGH